MINRAIIDCYTDEPSGLGVPPFLGTWPREIGGVYRDNPIYLNIDDIRALNVGHELLEKDIYNLTGKTNISFLNKQYSYKELVDIFRNLDQVIIIIGMQTPGKYLSARPGTIREIKNLLLPYKNIRKILTGPSTKFGTQGIGGEYAKFPSLDDFDEIRDITFTNYSDLQKIYLKGASLDIKNRERKIVEIETSRGCNRVVGCSFCTEPLKNRLSYRDEKFIIEEIKKYISLGYKYFRLGKQSCIFSYMGGNETRIETLLSGIRALEPEVLHIDNCNPKMVNEKRTKIFTKYLTAGSTAAFGIESFDENVIKLNNLNSDVETSIEAIKIINKFGKERDKNGNPILLPGINIILGLIGETEETLEKNFFYLKYILDNNLLIRRINIRQVVPYKGTYLYEKAGLKFLNKNKKFYKAWIDKVRHEIDLKMLEKVFPNGTILTNLYSVCYEGNVTFLRQFGSYSIIVGIKKRLPINRFYQVRVIGHNLRSLIGEII